jgi:dienelactone hydrolase
VPTLNRTLLADRAQLNRGGVTERMFHLEVEGDRLFAMLTAPEDPAAARDLGFLAVHSFGLEVLTLRRAERGVARALAAAGHPVLFVHRRGFGDSEGDPDDASLERQLADLRAAQTWLLANTAAERAGAYGAKFGGLLAGVLAREGGVDRMALFQPSTSGAQWSKSLVREMQVVRMADPDGDRRGLEDMLADLRRDGVLDVLGYGLPLTLYDALQDVDLTADLGSFGGDALVVQIAKRPTLAKDLEGLRDRVDAGAGRCETEVVREPGGSTFGSASFVATTSNVNIRTDVMAPVVAAIAQRTAVWAS